MEELNEKIMKLDGALITESHLNERIQEARSQGKMIKEISPGTFKTLQHLND